MAVRNMWRSYLLWCANEHVCFRLPEVESILSLYDIPHTWIEKPAENPWMVIAFPDESHAKKLMSRSVLIRSGFELWARSKTLENLHEQLKSLPSEITHPYFTAEKSFKVVVEIFNKVISIQEKIEKIESFSYLPVDGPVNLKNPDVTYYYFEFFGLDPGRVPEKPFDYFFGRWIGDSARSAISKYSLKTRHFIGNTSMDPQLAMIMANMAQVKSGDFTVDPFVGTGSLLIAAAHFGGFILGTDIDYLTLHGRSKPTRANQKKRQPSESIKGNLQQYGLLSQYVDVFVGDASRPIWRPGFTFDAILTDPPYGIREPTERVGSNRGLPVPEECLPTHYPQKTKYGLGEIFKDLLNLAADRLKMNGRLVYWIPVMRADYDEELLPRHPCLEIVANSEQILTNYSSRRLITMRKICEPKNLSHTATVAELSYTFRNKFFTASSEGDKAKEDELVKSKQLPKRSKRGNGVATGVETVTTSETS